MAKNDKHNLVKRGESWYFVTMYKGRRYHEVLSTNLKKSKELRNNYLDNLKRYGHIEGASDNLVGQVNPDYGMLFGEVAKLWSGVQEKRVKNKEIKFTTLRDYKSAMNLYVLPWFGDMPIVSISAYHVDDFVLSLECSGKRKKNILVPLRSIFKWAKKRGYVDKNIMGDVDKITVVRKDISPLSSEEVWSFLETTPLLYRPFFTALFFTGMRFGELAGLKWKNVDLDRNIIKIVETRVAGEEGVPKTKRNREVDILPPVREALDLQRQFGVCKKYVFRDKVGNLLTPDHARNQIWIPTLKEIGLEYRPMTQTRHTFATIAIDSGESLGWVQEMLGHCSLQMIMTTYYKWIKRTAENNGSAMMNKVEKSSPINDQQVAIQ